MTDREKIAKLHGALQALTTQMDEVHMSPEYMSVWTIWYTHCGDYEGPNYIKEFEAAKKALWDIRLPIFEEPENTSA